MSSLGAGGFAFDFPNPVSNPTRFFVQNTYTIQPYTSVPDGQGWSINVVNGDPYPFQAAPNSVLVGIPVGIRLERYDNILVNDNNNPSNGVVIESEYFGIATYLRYKTSVDGPIQEILVEANKGDLLNRTISTTTQITYLDINNPIPPHIVDPNAGSGGGDGDGDGGGGDGGNGGGGGGSGGGGNEVAPEYEPIGFTLTGSPWLSTEPIKVLDNQPLLVRAVYPVEPFDWSVFLTGTEVTAFNNSEGLILLGQASDAGCIIENIKAIRIAEETYSNEPQSGGGITTTAYLRFYAQADGDAFYLASMPIAESGNESTLDPNTFTPIIPTPQRGWRLSPGSLFYVGLSAPVPQGVNVFIRGGHYLKTDLPIV